MTARIVVRPARPENRPALVGFMAALQNHERAFHADRRPGEEMAGAHFAELERQATKTGGCVLLALEAGNPIGFLVGHVEGTSGHVEAALRRYGRITDVYVEPSARRRGVAARLIAAAEDHFRAAGLRRVLLAVIAGNAGARAAYRRLGYRSYEEILEKPLD